MLSSLPSFNRCKRSLALVAAGLTVAAGCGSPTPEVSTDEQASRPTVPAMTVASTPQPSQALGDQLLVGTWLGQAVLDEDVLEQTLVGKSVEQQDQLVVQAESFLSTVMAIEFRTDGTVESEVEMTPLGGKTIRDATVGQWRVSPVDADRLAVDTAELAPDGTTNITKRIFRFYPDRNAFVMTVPVPGELQDCNAMMIFERQSAVANVAQQPSETQRK